MDSKDEPASEARKSTDRYIPTVESDVNKTMQSLRDKLRISNKEITRLKAELEKAKDELQLAKFDYKAMFDEVKRLRSLLSEFEKMKAELERERELRKEFAEWRKGSD